MDEMITLLEKDKASIKDFCKVFKMLNPTNKMKLLCIGVGMASVEDVGNGNTKRESN